MQLYPYQKEGVCRLVKGSCLLLDEPGLGKTVETVVALRYLKPERVLIVCPKSMVDTWLTELDKWWSEGGFERCPTPKSWSALGTGSVRLVVNFEGVKAQGPFDVIVVDEAHKIKNRKAMRSILCRSVVRGAKVTWLLTGTPILNRADEIWHLLHMVDRRKFSSYWKFAETWCAQEPCRWSKSGISILPGVATGKERAFAKMLEPYVIRRTKQEVGLELPPVTRQVHWLEMEKSQAELHRVIMHAIKVQVSEGKVLTVANVLARTIYARRCAVSPLLVGGQCEGTKFWALSDLLDSLEGQKVVVFSQWTEPLFKFAEKHCGKDDHWFLHGQMSERSRTSEIAHWKGAKVGTLFATIETGGVGLTLTEASTAIFLDEPTPPALTNQAIARLDRIGQKKPVTIHFLRCKDSIEEWWSDLNGSKTKMVDRINQELSRLK